MESLNLKIKNNAMMETITTLMGVQNVILLKDGNVQMY